MTKQYEDWVDFNAGYSEESMTLAVRGLLQLALIHEQSGDLELGLRSCQLAIDLASRLGAGRFPDGTLEHLERLHANMLHQLGRSVEAETRLRKVLADFESRTHLDNFKMNHAELLHTAGRLHCGMADKQSDWETRTNYYLNALKDFDQAIAVWKLLETSDRAFDVRFGLATAMNGRGRCLHKAVDTVEAVKAYQQALFVLDQMRADFTDDQSKQRIAECRATIFANMGMSYMLLRDFGNAERVYQSAVATYQQLQSSLPLIVKYRDELARAWGNLADLYSEMHAVKPAVSEIKEFYARRQVIQISRTLMAERPHVGLHGEREVLHTVRLCYCMYRMRREREAAELFSQLLERHSSPEDVEHLSPRQRILCGLAYQLLSQRVLTSEERSGSMLWNKFAYVERAKRLLVAIDPKVIAADTSIYSLVIQDPVFQPVRNSADAEVQAWFLAIERIRNLYEPTARLLGR